MKLAMRHACYRDDRGSIAKIWLRREENLGWATIRFPLLNAAVLHRAELAIMGPTSFRC